MLYTYQCIIKRIIDADSIEVDIDLGFDTWLHNEQLRLSHIDCPEIRTRDLIEKEFGYLAKRRVEELLPIGSKFILYSNEYRNGGFGRILGDIQISETKKLTDILLEERHGVIWNPQGKELMAHQALENRKWLLENGNLPEEFIEKIKLLS